MTLHPGLSSEVLKSRSSHAIGDLAAGELVIAGPADREAKSDLMLSLIRHVFPFVGARAWSAGCSRDRMHGVSRAKIQREIAGDQARRLGQVE
jgi:hypothetical protein